MSPRLAAMLLVVAQAAIADVVAERPTYKVGDYWVYRRTQTLAEHLQRKGDEWHVRVIAITEEGNIVTDENRDNLYDPDFNPILRNGQEFNRIWLQFPLKVGDRWETERPRRKLGKGEAIGNFEVVGFEKITVPAGTFDCFHVVADDRKDGRHNGTWVKTDKWYCPDVKKIAKEVSTVIERHAFGPSFNNTITSELIDSNYLTK